MTKMKTTEIPSRAKHLYIKLYCEKKGGKTRENIHSASQSWLSLSLTKKQHFYDTVSTKSAIKKAQRIIQTEPFLRAKFPSHAGKQKRRNAESKEHQNRESDAENITTDNLVTSVHDDTIMECDNSSNSFVRENSVCEAQPMTTQLDTENTLQGRLEESVLELTQNEAQVCEVQNLQKPYMSVIDEDTDSANEDDANEKDADSIPLSEPVLPIIKTGRELFDLLKARNGLNKPYESLTKKEKHFYGRAVCAIKRDYVKKYKEYLESLSPKQLFDYYMKIFQ